VGIDGDAKEERMKTTWPPRCAIVIRAALLAVTLTAVPISARASDHHGGGPAGPPAAPAGVPLAHGAETPVDIQGVWFTPRLVTVHVGDTVIWTHRDSQLGHHVAAHDGSFDSHPTCGRPFGVCMKGGERFSYTFLRAGTYGYHCRVHDGMVGTVTVVE
jgi:plastocyanin